jgi:hypothetical protein
VDLHTEPADHGSLDLIDLDRPDRDRFERSRGEICSNLEVSHLGCDLSMNPSFDSVFQPLPIRIEPCQFGLPPIGHHLEMVKFCQLESSMVESSAVESSVV